MLHKTITNKKNIMKKLLVLALLALASCSPETTTEEITPTPDCDCDRVVEVNTFTVVGTPQNPALNYYSVYITINDCTQVQKRKEYTTTNPDLSPKVNQCR